MKIAVNRCFGGFSLTEAVFNELGIKWDSYGFLRNEDLGIKSDNWDAYRADPRLIAAIERVGEDASSGSCSMVRIVEIPDGIEWEIHEYDGQESVHEKHRSWSF